ncbi:MAG: sugar phosphate nucleotidyltransferase [Candidatus Altimarinota bacterium]
MKVIILAGGKSERISPFSEKPLLKFCGKPLIIHQVELLQGAGLKDFIVVGSASNLSRLKEYCQEFQNKNAGVNFEYFEQIHDDGSAGALKSIGEESLEDDVLIISSNDILEESAFEKMMSSIKENPGVSVILGQQIEKYFPGGYLLVNEQMELQKIVEKPGEGKEPSDLINIVLHYHPSGKELMEYVNKAKSEVDDIYETALQEIMNAGKKIKVCRYQGKWQPIKYPWHIYDAARMLFEKEVKRRGGNLQSGDLKKADSAVIKGEVIIEEGVKIMENAVIRGPVYLGKGCVVANNALVRESFLAEGCVAGFTTEIARSYLGRDVWTHSNYIGDSVIGNNVSFGAGANTGNLRLDEGNVGVRIKGVKVDSGRQKLGLIAGDNIRVGINVSFMPGVKVGGGTMIGGGVTINEDIGENKFVCAEKNQLVIKENNCAVTKSRDELMGKLGKS